VPRVLILSWEYPPIVEGGLARHVRKLAEGLVWAGAEVHVLARGGGRLAAIEDRHGVTVHRVREPEFPTDDLDAFVRWVDAMNDDMRAAGAALGDTLSFDLVHSYDWLVAGAARRLARRFGCPWLVTVHPTEHGRHQGWIHKHPQRHIHGVERRMVRAADRVITCSHYMRGHVAEVFGIDEGGSRSCPRRRSRRPPARRRPAAAAGALRRRPASGSCCWSGGSSTRRASTSRSTRSRA
jgi:glycogen synthase